MGCVPRRQDGVAFGELDRAQAEDDGACHLGLAVLEERAPLHQRELGEERILGVLHPSLLGSLLGNLVEQLPGFREEVQQLFEVLFLQLQQLAVLLCPNACRPPLGQEQGDLAEVTAAREVRHDLVALENHLALSSDDEVHLLADLALAHDPLALRHHEVGQLGGEGEDESLLGVAEDVDVADLVGIQRLEDFRPQLPREVLQHPEVVFDAVVAFPH